ncbi:sel1 repeat family protein [Pseudomonas faucium]|uniref:sel1 repeat family protein n=1 Tax=Pseudomonas faucium TaxID=2740518 RepID=UPI001596E31E|nr:sel1 repeat family protein [Pseudomonas faucium]
MTKRSNLFVIAVAAAVIASIFTLGEWRLNKKNIWDELAQDAPEQPEQAATFLREAISNFSDAQLSNLARSIVESRDIKFSQTLTNSFIYTGKDKESKRLAVFIAEQGFILKGDIVLANRAALEYKMGRFVQKNVEKATTIFTSPVLINVPISKFYLAEMLLDDSNPNKDPIEAQRLLKESAAAGIVAAKKKLKETM